MEKLPMCRLCLACNVRMNVVVNKGLYELYERLTDNPFVTGDSRPMLACFICCTKLKQCYQLQRKCLEAEELLTQMMNEDYKLNPLINQDHFGCCNELIISPMEHVNIQPDGESQAECDDIKVELPAVCERQNDVIEPEEEHQSDELKLENVYSSFSVTEDVPAKRSDSETEVPLMEFKTEVEEQEVSKMRRVSDTTQSAVAKKQKLHIRVKKIEENQKKNEESVAEAAQNKSYCTSKLIPIFTKPLTDTKLEVDISVCDTTLDTNYQSNNKKRKSTKHIRIRTGGTSYKCDICQYSCNNKRILISHIRVHSSKKLYKCEKCQRCFTRINNLTRHIRTHTGDKPYKCEECQRCFSQKVDKLRHIRTHTGEKPYKCKECQRCFAQKNHLTRHIRMHTGEKPYKCKECGRCFTRINNLTRHIRTHTGDKPYKCG